MFPGGDGGPEQDLYHVHSGRCLVTHMNSGEWEGKEDLRHVCSAGCSVTHVPSTSNTHLAHLALATPHQF